MIYTYHTQKQQAFYDQFYGEGRSHVDQKVLEGIKEYFIHRFLDRTIKDDSAKILEIGCGDGLLTGYLLARDLRVHAVDISAVGIARLKSGYRSYIESGQLVAECDEIVNFLSKTRQKFDLIIGAGIIHHIDKKEWPTFFSAIHRNLNKGGMLGCGPEPNANLPYCLFWQLAQLVYERIYHIPYDREVEKGTLDMKSNDLLRGLLLAGFSHAQIKPFHVLPHFSCALLARLDKRLVESVSGRFAMYTIIEAQK